MTATKNESKASAVETAASTVEKVLDTVIPKRLGMAGELIRTYPLLSGAIAYLAVGAVTAYFIRAASCRSRAG